MRRIMVCALVICSSLAFGQAASAKKADAPSVEQALMQMERDWTQAGLKKDVATLDKIIADDWTAFDFQGKPETKAQVIADLKSGSSFSQTVELGEMKVKVFGDTAVVTGSDMEKSTYKGKDSSGKYVWTDVFVKRNGRWQAVSSMSVKLP